MARLVKRLSARKVASAKPPKGRDKAAFADGGNLFLQTSRSDDGNIRRSWLFQYELNGKRGWMGLGPTHTVTLGEAREKARELRRQLLDGIAPLAAKQEQDQQRQLEASKQKTFAECVNDYIEAHEDSWKNAKHRAQWRMTLTQYCKAIADLPVKDIDTNLVLDVLKPIWKTKTDTAKRLRGRIERVLSYATGIRLRSGENPARWQGHLDEMLAAPSKLRPVRHQPALPYADMPAFMADLRANDSISARALELTILCATRTSETIEADWSEFDLDAKTWTVPATRTKSARKHKIPLCDRAVAILKGLPGQREGRLFDLSNMAMLQMVRRMRPGMTTHGFRSTFRDWAGEETAFPHDICEAALAHIRGDKTVEAYARGDLLKKRGKLMEAWSKYCASRPIKKTGDVIPIRAGAEASA